jgi:dipeptidyl aminopeptidase/acylaminoacyl peptidase
LTTDQQNSFPVWHPDGRSLTFSSSGGRPMNLSELAVDGSSPSRPLLRSSQWQRPAAWTPDGRSLVFVETSPGTGQDLWLFTRGAQPRPLLRSRFLEGGAQISPDGTWLAYVSDESGRYEVYVRALGGSLPRVQASVLGGTEPVWSPDGHELYYRLGRELFAVDFRAGIPPQLGRPRRLFEGDFAESLGPFPNYDAWPGRRGFVMVHEERPAMAGQIEVVLGLLGTRSTGASSAPRVP